MRRALVISWFVALSCSTSNGPGNVEPIPLEAVGGVCTNVGCGGDLCGIKMPDQCPRKLCLVDTRGGLSSMTTYCSAECTEGACPAGYDCLEMSVASDVKRACVAQPRVCGDGVLQRGEQCDDGNAEGDDGCSAECEKEKPVHLRLTGWSFVHRSLSSAQREVSFADVEGDLPLAGDARGCGRASRFEVDGRLGIVVELCHTDGSTLKVTLEFPPKLGIHTSGCGLVGPLSLAAAGRVASGPSFAVPSMPCDPGDDARVAVLELRPNGGVRAKLSGILTDRGAKAVIGLGGAFELSR